MTVTDTQTCYIVELFTDVKRFKVQASVALCYYYIMTILSEACTVLRVLASALASVSVMTLRNAPNCGFTH
jgi:hypothetical protein